MHESLGILALPNACDAATARAFDDAGFAAIGTTSSGIATAIGYRMTKASAATKCWRRPSESAPLRFGPGIKTAPATATARGVIAARTAGLNLEDAPLV
jgi:hypothetical protein